MRTALLSLALIASPALALNEGLQCVPFARAVTGVEIRGDAHTWWDQAAGHYARGSRPKVGAVMALKPYGGMQLGHVAAVRKIIDSRTILVSHANWSLINGIRGHIEENVRVVDVSDAGDWSAVRVWFASLGDLGTTAWPVQGFIYPDHPRSDREIRSAVSALTGHDFAVTRPTQTAQPQPRETIIAAPAKPKNNFQLSWGLLNEINKVASKEAGYKR